MAGPGYYCRTLNYAGAAIDRCMNILDYWEDGMNAAALYDRMLKEGKEANFTAKSLKHSVGEVFKLRYLSEDALPWTSMLKQNRQLLSGDITNQVCYLLTARCEAMLRDFMTMEYWPRVRRGDKTMDPKIFKAFISVAVSDNRGGGKWTESRFERASRSLSAVCLGFQLFKRESGALRFVPPSLLDCVALALVYDLKEQGCGGSALFRHEDWKLFGLSDTEVRQLLSQPALAPFFSIEESMTETRISWRVQTMKEAVGRYVAR